MGMKSAITRGEHLRFEEVEVPKRKLSIWEIFNVHDNTLVGEVRFTGRWRKYVFYPAPDTFFDTVCMRDIAQFTDDVTKEWREQIKRG